MTAPHLSHDVVVVGSGITGGWVAKDLTERGLRVLLLERGRAVEHGIDYPTEGLAPWDLRYRGFGNRVFRNDPIGGKGTRLVNELVNEYNEHFFVPYAEAPYQTPDGAPFHWIRGHQLGGRSLTWSRQSLRWGPQDFAANGEDGHGIPWPIGYDDLAPWYDRVESFAGISGSAEGLPQLPDGKFQPSLPLNAFERHFAASLGQRFTGRRLVAPRTANLTAALPGRAPCMHRDACARGCSMGAYFSTQSSTLPAARATGRLTVRTDALVERLAVDKASGKVTGVRVVDSRSGQRETIPAPLIVLCASAFATVQILLATRQEPRAEGLGGPALGLYAMDHPKSVSASGVYAGCAAHGYSGRRSSLPIVARFCNLADDRRSFSRGYFYNLIAFRLGWSRGGFLPGVGADFKDSLSRPGPWGVALVAFAECLPSRTNRLTLDPARVDRFGIPQLRIELRFGTNELDILKDAEREAVAMLKAAGVQILATSSRPAPPGSAVHEMGGACIGTDPGNSVVDRVGRLHDAPNVLVADGALMSSSACQNPSLTYMAMASRIANLAADRLTAGTQ